MEAFEVDGGRLVWRGDGETLVVEPWGRDSLRVRATLQSEILDSDFALLPPGAVECDVVVDGPRATISSGRLHAVLEAATVDHGGAGYQINRCAVSFYNSAGKLLLSELAPGGSLHLTARQFRPRLGGNLSVTASFEADRDEKLYGMGEYQQAILDIKGCTFELAHRNSQASVPFILSNAGYGFLWHNPAIGRATFANNRTEWFAESTRQLDYWITAGDTPAEITAAYADATGHVPMMPERGLGFWQCKLRYWNQEQLLKVAREHKRRGLPLDVMVADFFHWPKMGDFRFEKEFWPDPRAMVEELRGLGVELMVSVWPQVSLDSENYPALRKQNMLVRAERGLDIDMSFQGPSAFIDVTNPSTRAYVWGKCQANYFDSGIRTFWLDEAEPEYGVYDFDNYRYHLGPALQVGNLYPQLYARMFSDGQRASGQDDIVNLVRCAWAGSQRYGALAWSGDIESTFEALRRQITAGIHMGVAGISWFTTDIGGFHDGDVHDPGFHELLVRWFQFGTFCPVMRLHGDRKPAEEVRAADGSARLRSGGPNELWSYGEQVYEILAKYVHLREKLRPYTRRAMAEAHIDGQPVMRGLFHGFWQDPRCWDVADEYLFGPDLLVAPVVEPGATSREVYLPAGARWTELHGGETYQGGQSIVAEAPIAVIPVYACNSSLPDLIGRL